MGTTRCPRTHAMGLSWGPRDKPWFQNGSRESRFDIFCGDHMRLSCQNGADKLILGVTIDRSSTKNICPGFVGGFVKEFGFYPKRIRGKMKLHYPKIILSKSLC